MGKHRPRAMNFDFGSSQSGGSSRACWNSSRAHQVGVVSVSAPAREDVHAIPDNECRGCETDQDDNNVFGRHCGLLESLEERCGDEVSVQESLEKNEGAEWKGS